MFRTRRRRPTWDVAVGEHGGVGYHDVTVRPLVIDDLDWVVHLAAEQAEQRQNFAPRFWRRAPDARRVHARHLRALIDNPGIAALRTDHLFAFAIAGSQFLLVDDAAGEDERHWAAEGPALFRRLAGRSRLRFVCPVPEPERAALAAGLGVGYSAAITGALATSTKAAQPTPSESIETIGNHGPCRGA